MYKVLFLDFDDTLIDTLRNSRVAMESLYGDSILSSLYPHFDSYYNTYFELNSTLWHRYHHGLISKEELKRVRFYSLLKEKGVDDISLSEELNHRFIELVSQQTAMIPFAYDLLNYLRPKYPLYMLSNGFREAQDTKLANCGILPYFDVIILSEDIGANKPDPRIFTHALQLAGCAPQEALMIGDNPDTDILGAKRSNIDQLYFNPQGRKDLNFTPTFEVDCLSKIINIL